MTPRVFPRRKLSWVEDFYVQFYDYKLQRGRALSSADTRPTRGDPNKSPPYFNGAALFQARIHPLCQTESRFQHTHFNGAALFQARIRAMRPLYSPTTTPLQWGRALSSADTRVARRNQDPPAVTSMGPRSFKRGYSYLRTISKSLGSVLQWGRALSSADTVA